MVCNTLLSITSISDFLVWPTGCDFYFYLKILLVIFAVLTWTLYKAEKKVRQSADIISAMGVSALAMLILGLIGSLIKNTDNIPMISIDVLLPIFAVAIPLILIWIFKK